MDNSKPTWRPWIVCFSAALFFLYEFIQINMFNAISPGLIKSFGLNATQLGNLSATYLYSTVLCLFPIGILLDRFSTRKLIMIAMSVCVICTVLFSLSTSFSQAVFFRFIAGGAGAFCFLSSLMLAARWFPNRKLALVTGLIVTMAMIGGVMAQTPLTLLADHLTWRYALLCNATLGLIFILIIGTFVQDYPEGYVKEIYKINFWTSIKVSITNYQNWFCGMYTCLLNLLILLLGAVWGASYLETVHHLTRAQASYVTTMIFVGTIIGSPIMGWCSDKIGRRKLPMIFGAFLSLILISFVIVFSPLDFNTLLILFLLLGITTSTQIISYPVIAESNPSSFIGTSEGIANSVIMAGGAVFQPVFGWLLDLHWNGLTLNNLRIYTGQDFHYAILILPVGFAISLLLSLALRETYCGINSPETEIKTKAEWVNG